MAAFLAHFQQFSRLFDKFEVWVSCEAVATFLIGYSVWFFKMELNPLPDLLNIRFTIIEIGLFYGGKHFGSKTCRFLTFLPRSLHDGDFWSVLNRRWRLWKHFKYWPSYFNVLLKHWAYFPKGKLINSKIRYLLYFF